MSLQVLHKHYLGKARKYEILTPDQIKKSDALRDYFANIHFIEILNNEEKPDVTILKTFFINETRNLNDWEATWEGLKQDAKELPGTPLVLQEDLEHPKYSVQKYFDRGTIFAYDIDEEKRQIIVYVRITDPSIIERIKSGELQYVSPAVIPKGSEYIKKVNGVDVLSRTLPLHLAIVGDPAYGKENAKMTHLCSGNGTECFHRLKIMKAARDIYTAAEDCVSKKIKIIKNERPTISNEQAAAIAYSMCKRGTASSSAPQPNTMDPLTQIPLIKKVQAALNRLDSTMEQKVFGMKYAIHNGYEGNWIKAKGMDVFVPRNSSISQAMMAQCGCDLLMLEKVTKEEGHYRATSNKVQNCSTCKYFDEKNNSCQVVDGEITLGHVSDLWESKYQT